VTWPQRLLGVVFLTSGVLHFLRPDVYEQIMPGYVPAHREVVLASGAAEIAGAAAVAFPRTRSAAGLWLAAVLVAVFPANVHMALHPGRYPSLPAGLLWARLPLQPLLVWWALRATRGRAGGES
jgi:uncharacterized membrane protein